MVHSVIELLKSVFHHVVKDDQKVKDQCDVQVGLLQFLHLLIAWVILFAQYWLFNRVAVIVGVTINRLEENMLWNTLQVDAQQRTIHLEKHTYFQR